MSFNNSFDQIFVDGISVQLTGSAPGDIWWRDVAGNLARLAIGAPGEVLTVSPSLLPVWQTSVLPDGSVTFDKIRPIGSNRILGRNAAGSGAPQELDPPAVRGVLGLGTAATANTGTTVGTLPVLDADGKLPVSVIPSIALVTPQTVANQAARLALANVQIGDFVKQADNGRSYTLAATPASTDGNWIEIGDSAIVATDVSGLGPWATVQAQAVSANTTMVANSTYLAVGTTAGTPVVLTLPAAVPVGSLLTVIGVGVAGWRIAQSVANHQICHGRYLTTSGPTGFIASTLYSTHRNTVQLIATGATSWQLFASQGPLDIN